MTVKVVAKQIDANVNKQKSYVTHAVIIRGRVIRNNLDIAVSVFIMFEITSMIHLVEVTTSTTTLLSKW